MKKILLLLMLAFAFSSCEKDDICDASTATTPRLVVEFYEWNSPTPALKSVSNLKVIAPGFTNALPTFNGTKAMIPLKTDVDATTYSFIQNGADTDATNDNEDILEFHYSRNNVFVSRACGFKTLFNFNTTSPIIQSEPLVPDGTWIKNIIIVKPNLETENEVHVQIYF